MIYIDADSRLTTWRYIMEAGGYQHYQGHANQGDVVIRWGANHSRYQNRYPTDVRVLNPRLILNKRDQITHFVNSGVITPKVFNSREEWEQAGSPRLLKKPTMGQGGSGVAVISAPPRIWTGDVLYQIFIDKDREFRAMMVGELLAFFMEKHRPANGDVRWNEHRGSQWTRVPPDDHLRRVVKDMSYAACRALGYDFGAVDLIIEGRDLYVLEVNSRPEFGPVNARRFVNAINQYLQTGAVRQRVHRQSNREVPTIQQRFCYQCGIELGADWHYCEGCGRQL